MGFALLLTRPTARRLAGRRCLNFSKVFCILSCYPRLALRLPDSIIAVLLSTHEPLSLSFRRYTLVPSKSRPGRATADLGYLCTSVLVQSLTPECRCAVCEVDRCEFQYSIAIRAWKPWKLGIQQTTNMLRRCNCRQTPHFAVSASCKYCLFR